MSGSGQKKSLTEPPTNLKEAIDWVLQINGHAEDLAEKVEELLKHDGSEVAVKVLENYRHVSESVIKGLNQNDRCYFAETALTNLSEGLRPFHPQSEANINFDDVEKVKEWALKVDESYLKTLIEALDKGLKTFVDQGSGIGNRSYTNTYNSAASWISLTPSDKTDCAAILLGIMPVVYFGLTYLYWRCSQNGGTGWKNQSLNGSGGQDTLKKYVNALGYTTKLNDKNGGVIVSQIMKNMFSSELKSSDAASNEYPKFLKALQDKAITSIDSLSSTKYPLTSLYLISYYYITNFLYTVETSSPATPSFLGYSGPAILAGGVYGFNLGGVGTFMSALLA
ncbi:variant erythrocyte surface antigen-1 family protein [Babesia caballi]|uniref:Variant erythrocyte surface antigen-1 family protein n=1 Tax=Babesia caballi TaxID=5871 RepID=A0AAV4LN79_BABCB|nr:variant erythrocyte surface antigen-1 family protein [Babesia caballi]